VQQSVYSHASLQKSANSFKDHYGTAAKGAIALVNRGGCQFLQKSVAAAGAGVVALIIYNDSPAPFALRLSGKKEELIHTIPTASLSGAEGLALVAQLKESRSTQAELVIDSVVNERPT
jgi:hypothetical protein